LVMDRSGDGDLAARLSEAENRLTAIAELASSPVVAQGTPEANLADAEARLTEILELARRDR
jgi:hypothetical protein